jgi:ATP-dependent helicase/nuclease subunit B
LFRLPTDLNALLQRGGTLLVPTRQRVRAVQLAHAAGELARGHRVWASADVLTPAAWMRRECERRAGAHPADWPRLLGSAEEWLLWRQAAREAAGTDVFLDEGALAEALQRASELAAEYALKVPAGAPESEVGLLHAAQRLFDARCRELNAASLSALAPRLFVTDAADEAPLLLRGFDALSPRLRALGAARAPGDGLVSAAPHATPREVRTAQGSGELEAIAAWCGERLGAQPDARLLVMLPGPAGARERLAALIREVLDPADSLCAARENRALVGIEGGQPFAELPLPAQALASLALLAGAETDPESLSRWLMAPQWGSPAAAPRAALALMLRQRALTSLNLRALLGALQLAPPELVPAARELDALLHRAARALGEARGSPRRWSERFEAALAALTWPGGAATDPSGQQTRLRWRELLEEFGTLEACVELLSREQALELLRSLAARTPYRPADEDVSVTLSPMLADPVVCYDGLWVGSLSADVLPQPVAPDPFLPLSAQVSAGVPAASAAGRRAQAQTLLKSWRAGTSDLVLSVPAHEQDLELLPSPLLGAPLPLDAPARCGWLAARVHREGLIESLVDARGLAWNSAAPLPEGTRSLTLQSACAFRAYAELRLGATAPKSAEPGIPMDQRGLLLHAALQALWERLRDSASLAALSPGALEALIRDAVAQAALTLQAEPRGHRRRRRAPDGQFDLFAEIPPVLARECRRAERLIRRLCELERERAPFSVVATEAPAELALCGARLRMRLDRIDSIGSGRVILDYKSGQPGTPDWYGERPTHPQLLAYLAALGADVIALATVHVNTREVRFCGVAGAPQLLPRVKALPTAEADLAAAWRAQQAQWQRLIERLISAFLAGDARVDPAPGACDYCHLSALCRIAEHRGGATELAPAEDADE